MAKNATWREIHKFVAFSGVGKKQAAYDDFMLPADIDTRDACRVEQNDNVTRTLEYDCDGVDLTGEPISRRFAQFRFTYEKFTGQMAARFKAYEQGVSAASTGAAANDNKKRHRFGRNVYDRAFISGQNGNNGGHPMERLERGYSCSFNKENRLRKCDGQDHQAWRYCGFG
jgi:hypothetical protein